MPATLFNKRLECTNCGADMKLKQVPSFGSILLFSVLNPLTIFDGGLATRYHEEKMKCTGCGLEKKLGSTPQADVLGIFTSLLSLTLILLVALTVVFRALLWSVLFFTFWLISSYISDAVSFNLHDIQKTR